MNYAQFEKTCKEIRACLENSPESLLYYVTSFQIEIWQRIWRTEQDDWAEHARLDMDEEAKNLCFKWSSVRQCMGDMHMLFPELSEHRTLQAINASVGFQEGGRIDYPTMLALCEKYASADNRRTAHSTAASSQIC